MTFIMVLDGFNCSIYRQKLHFLYVNNVCDLQYFNFSISIQFRFNFLTKSYKSKINLRKVTIYLLTSCNTEERIAQNIYIHNSNRNYKKKKSTTTTILIKKRIGIGYKNYGKQCPGLEFRLIPKLISWAGLKPKKFL